MVKLYYGYTDFLEDEEVFSGYYDCASPERRAKIDRLRYPGDKRLSLLAEVLLTEGLKGLGLTREGTFHNLSHSGNISACIISDVPAGVDVEIISDYNDRLARRFFHPDEYAFLLSLSDPEEKRLAFFRFWTLKESFIKATGEGMKIPLNEFCIYPHAPVTISQKYDNYEYHFWDSKIDGRYHLSACTRGTDISGLHPERLF